ACQDQERSRSLREIFADARKSAILLATRKERITDLLDAWTGSTAPTIRANSSLVSPDALIMSQALISRWCSTPNDRLRSPPNERASETCRAIPAVVDASLGHSSSKKILAAESI